MRDDFIGLGEEKDDGCSDMFSDHVIGCVILAGSFEHHPTTCLLLSHRLAYSPSHGAIEGTALWVVHYSSYTLDKNKENFNYR